MMLAVMLRHTEKISALRCFLITVKVGNILPIKLTGTTQIVTSQMQFYMNLFFWNT